MKCVYCKKAETNKAESFYPFCSERCKLLDLGQWANESYRIPATSLPDESEVPEEDSHEVENESLH